MASNKFYDQLLVWTMCSISQLCSLTSFFCLLSGAFSRVGMLVEMWSMEEVNYLWLRLCPCGNIRLILYPFEPWASLSQSNAFQHYPFVWKVLYLPKSVTYFYVMCLLAGHLQKCAKIVSPRYGSACLTSITSWWVWKWTKLWVVFLCEHYSYCSISYGVLQVFWV